MIVRKKSKMQERWSNPDGDRHIKALTTNQSSEAVYYSYF